MLVPQVISLLEGKLKEDGSGNVEVDAGLIKAAVEGLQEHQALEKQVAQLQEQMSMKPSVARKLAEKIKKLEMELEVTQNASRVKELERKVQKLELDLKASYSTKNFTLKQGLLDLEKRYRMHIYGNEGMEELWQEVMYLLAEDKDKEGAPPSLKRLQTQRRQPGADGEQVEEGEEEEMPNMEFVPFFSTVQRTKDVLKEAREREARLRELAAANGDGPLKFASIPTTRTDWDEEQLAAGNQVRLAFGSHIDALRALFDGGGPIFPGAGPDAAAIAQEELAALRLRVGALLDMWAQRTLEGPVTPGSERAAELEAVAQDVLAAIRALRDKYGGNPKFDKQMAGLMRSINELRASWGMKPDPEPIKLPPLSPRSRRPSRAPGSPHVEMGQGRTRELVEYFMSFLQAKGYVAGGVTDLDGPLPLPPFQQLFAEFSQYMQENGRNGAVAKAVADANAKALEQLPAWMHPLPTLRIAAAATAAGMNGASDAAVLESALPGTPPWWAAALHAAGEQDDQATAVPGSGPAAGKPSAGFNPLLLPGPARTMQALAAHVRAQHGELLAAHPEVETALQAALQAASELQAAQDRSLLQHARNGTSPVVAGQPGSLMSDVSVVPCNKEDYTAEIEEQRAIAAKHAEHAASLQELLTKLAAEHTQANERADDMDVRLSLADKETKLMKDEVDNLTKLLVEVKMAYAERTDEVERLSARLKRSLADEKAALDEVEELRTQLAVVVDEQMALDAEYEQAMVQALEVLDKGAEVLEPEALPLAAVTGAGGNVEALTNAAAPSLGLPPTPPTRRPKKLKKAPPKIITPAQVQAAAMVIVNQGGPPPDAVASRYCALPVVAGAGVIQDMLVDRTASGRSRSLVRSSTTSNHGAPAGPLPLDRPSTASMAGSVAGSVAPSIADGTGSRSMVARVLATTGSMREVGEHSMRRPSFGSRRISLAQSQSEGSQSGAPWHGEPDAFARRSNSGAGDAMASPLASPGATTSFPVHVGTDDEASEQPDGTPSAPLSPTMSTASKQPHEGPAAAPPVASS